MIRSVSKWVFLLLLIECSASTKKDALAHLDLVGIWQVRDYLQSSGWPDVYQFFPDGQFMFKPTQYNGLNRILTIGGAYRIEGDTLYLTVKYTDEAIGGELTRSTITTLSDSWELNDYQVQKIPHGGTREVAILIDSCEENYPKDCVLLDGRKYFRMTNDPTKY